MKKFEEYILEKGFRKHSKTSYYKVLEDPICHIKIRKSNFSELAIIDLGVYFPFGQTDKKESDILMCQLTSSASKLIPEAFNWPYEEFLESFPFEKEFDIILNELDTVSDLNYLKDHFPNDFDHDKWWLANIRESDFVAEIKNLHSIK